MREAILRKAAESAALVESFVTEHCDRIEACARAMADRVGAGGRLWVMGNGGSACDAQHMAVEFQHPIIEKRRPLPAMALCVDVALLTAVGNDDDFARTYARQVELLACDRDIAVGMSSSGASSNVNRALRSARARGALTVGFVGRDGGPMRDLCDHAFVVPSWSIHRVQEAHTVLLHILWDQVHVALGEDDVL